jgi:hypothetical protein
MRFWTSAGLHLSDGAAQACAGYEITKNDSFYSIYKTKAMEIETDSCKITYDFR